MRAAAPTSPASQATAYAYFVLATLTLLNLLNYVDRYIFSALVPYIKAETGYTDAQLGLVGSAFTWVYTLCSPLFGYFGDRYHRGRLIAIGIFIWSLATAAAGLARSLMQLLVARAAVGVGEANYATIAPSLLADYFPKARRGLVMSIFQSTIPIGAAAGFILGGYLGAPDAFGWRHTLLIVGLPGLLAATAMAFIREPQRGVMDEPTEQAAALESIGWMEGYWRLLNNRGYVFTCLGYAAVTFALGALVFWAPEWMKTDKGLSEKEANLVLGICAVVGGTFGSLIGGFLGDALNQRLRGVRGYFLLCAVSGGLACIPMFVALVSTTPWVYQACTFITLFLVYIGNGPANTLVVSLVAPNLRTTATGFLVVAIHVFGDGISLALVGWISTYLRGLATAGQPPPAVVSSVAAWCGLSPTTQTLSVALLLMPVALIVAGLLYGFGLLAPEAKGDSAQS
ncbi:MAG: MFS transporter [Chloracidobacterium sp.]|uniref:MFS transporter n=1 Tax=Chloracidobacterium validum TaxID=2821543 RepID=A0ABX8B9E6_9BACT|nr:MFS transporter [Chloracidobacterium validum]QUW02263.1 MFS transporter [Chloracidobacterium validum]